MKRDNWWLMILNAPVQDTMPDYATAEIILISERMSK